MPAYNRVLMMGHLTRDPELKYLPSQTAVVEFGLAVNHKYRTKTGEDREDVCFVDCAAFGKIGEVINEYFQKGKPIFIEGRLKYDTWESEGGKRSKHSVVVEGFQFMVSNNGERSDARRESVPPKSLRPNRAQPEQPFNDEKAFAPDDIPF